MGKQSHTLHKCLSVGGDLLGPCPMLHPEGTVISSKPSPLCLILLPCCCKTKLYLIVFGCAENNKKGKSKAAIAAMPRHRLEAETSHHVAALVQPGETRDGAQDNKEYSWGMVSSRNQYWEY